MSKEKKWDGGIVVRLTNGEWWSRDWTFTTRGACSKPAKVIAAAQQEMSREKVKGRSAWRRYTLTVDLRRR